MLLVGTDIEAARMCTSPVKHAEGVSAVRVRTPNTHSIVPALHPHSKCRTLSKTEEKHTSGWDWLHHHRMLMRSGSLLKVATHQHTPRRRE